MTAQLALDDCEPDWTTDYEPADHTPTPFDCRQHEMRDLQHQHAAPIALWTAETINTGRYL